MPIYPVKSSTCLPVLRAVMVRALVEMAASGLFPVGRDHKRARQADVHRTGRTSRAACRIRQAGMYLAHVVFAMSMTRSGHLFARDRTTARFACLQVEEWRENANVDRAFDRLEPALAHWMAHFAPPRPAARRKRKKAAAS